MCAIALVFVITSMFHLSDLFAQLTGSLRGAELVQSVKMRLKSLSGLSAEEKRNRMRAMAEELQKVGSFIPL